MVSSKVSRMSRNVIIYKDLFRNPGKPKEEIAIFSCKDEGASPTGKDYGIMEKVILQEANAC